MLSAEGIGSADGIGRTGGRAVVVSGAFRAGARQHLQTVHQQAAEECRYPLVATIQRTCGPTTTELPPRPHRLIGAVRSLPRSLSVHYISAQRRRGYRRSEFEALPAVGEQTSPTPVYLLPELRHTTDNSSAMPNDRPFGFATSSSRSPLPLLSPPQHRASLHRGPVHGAVSRILRRVRVPRRRCP